SPDPDMGLNIRRPGILAPMAAFRRQDFRLRTRVLRRPLAAAIVVTVHAGNVWTRRRNAMPASDGPSPPPPATASSPPFGVDPADQLLDHGAGRKWHQAYWCAKGDLSSKGIRPPEQQSDSRGIHKRSVIDIHDVRECNPFFLISIPDDQRITGVQDFVDEVE